MTRENCRGDRRSPSPLAYRKKEKVMAGKNGKDYTGKKLSPQEAEKVVADLKEYLMGVADRWLFKGRFHTELAKGTLPMEAIKVFWQNWYGFVAEINNFH